MNLKERILRSQSRVSSDKAPAGLAVAPIASRLAASQSRAKPLYAIVACFARGMNPALQEALGLEEGEAVFVNVAGAGSPHQIGELERSLGVAIFLLGAQEVIVFGHQACKMSQMEMNSIIDEFRKQGVHRQAFGDTDLRRWFGAFQSPAKNIQEVVEKLSQSAVIPSSVSIHGLLFDDVSGKVEILVEGKPRASSGKRLDAIMHSVPPLPKGLVSQVAEPPLDPARNAAPEAVALRGPKSVETNVKATEQPPMDFNRAFLYLRQFLTRLHSDDNLRGRVADLKQRLTQERDPVKFLKTLETFAGQFEKERQSLLQAVNVVRSTLSQDLTSNELRLLIKNLFQ